MILHFQEPNNKVIPCEETNFKLKIETLQQLKHAHALFLNKDFEEEYKVPEKIK
ncbi:12549_t:CDS:1, partial [Cetraspora pellucida]